MGNDTAKTLALALLRDLSALAAAMPDGEATVTEAIRHLAFLTGANEPVEKKPFGFAQALESA